LHGSIQFLITCNILTNTYRECNCPFNRLDGTCSTSASCVRYNIDRYYWYRSINLSIHLRLCPALPCAMHSRGFSQFRRHIRRVH
jgi:hypothetical protein